MVPRELYCVASYLEVQCNTFKLTTSEVYIQKGVNDRKDEIFNAGQQDASLNSKFLLSLMVSMDSLHLLPVTI